MKFSSSGIKFPFASLFIAIIGFAAGFAYSQIRSVPTLLNTPKNAKLGTLFLDDKSVVEPIKPDFKSDLIKEKPSDKAQEPKKTK